MKTVNMFTILVLALGLMAWQVEVSEAVPMGTAFTYQGRLLDANDTADGEYDFQFRLFDAPNGGVQQGSTIGINDLDVIDGYFTVELDFGGNVFGGDARWLQIGVREGATNDPFTILSPRQEVTPTPYALYAESGPGVPVPFELSGSVAYPGAVIKGTNTGTGYGVYGKHDSSGNYGYLGYSNHGVYGYSYSDYGVRGYGGNSGVYGLSSDGNGVYGLSTNGYGVYGENHSSGNYGFLGYIDLGVYGYSESGEGVRGTSSTNYGVHGFSNTGTAVYGIRIIGANYGYLGGDYGAYGEHEGSDNYGYLGSSEHGVYGEHNTSGNFGYLGSDSVGAYGKHNSSGNFGYLGSELFGVYGKHNTSGDFGYIGYSNRGVYGFSTDGHGVHGESATDTAVYGIHTSSANYGYLGSDKYGVYGSSNVSSAVRGEHTISGNHGHLGTSARGVYGSSASGVGVEGYSSSGTGVSGYSNTGRAVEGFSIDGYAGYFLGNVYVTNNVSALSFTDRTPYPKDLETAYQAVMSMERLPDGQYDENNRELQLDHSKLSDFIKSKDGNRDLSATVSCHNEVLKHLIRKNDELEKAYVHIGQLNKRIIALEAKLVKLEAGLNIVQ